MITLTKEPYFMTVSANSLEKRYIKAGSYDNTVLKDEHKINENFLLESITVTFDDNKNILLFEGDTFNVDNKMLTLQKNGVNWKFLDKKTNKLYEVENICNNWKTDEDIPVCYICNVLYDEYVANFGTKED